MVLSVKNNLKSQKCAEILLLKPILKRINIMAVLLSIGVNNSLVIT